MRSDNQSARYYGVVATISACLLFGGARLDPGPGLAIICLIASSAFFFILYGRGWAAFQSLPLGARVILGLAATAPMLQLVPLPPVVWHALPGRDTEIAVLELAGRAGSWRPLSMTPIATLLSQIYLIVPLIVFAGVLTLSPWQRLGIYRIIIVAALATLVIGSLQVATGGSPTFHSSPHRDYLLGLFSNRNHAALFLALGLASAAVVMSAIPDRRSRWLWFSLAFILAFAGAIATMSRAGILAVLVTMFIALYAMPGLSLDRGRKTLFAGAMTAGGAGIMAISVSKVGDLAERVASVSADKRWEVWQHSISVARDHFPFGGGAGSFALLYQHRETLEMLGPRYANHAHNDYIETLVDYGLYGMLLIAGIAGIALCGMVCAARRDSETKRQAVGASMIVIATALLSLTDYPSRRIAIAVVFAFALAILVDCLRAQTSWASHVDK